MFRSAGCCLLQLPILLTVFIACDGFNLDVKHPLTAVGEQGSYFGYSLAVHEENAIKK